jgi:hypothetical protein
MRVLARLAALTVPLALAVMVLAAMGGCSTVGGAHGSSTVPPATTSAPTTAAAFEYVAPPDLCPAVDLAALVEVYPTLGKPQSHTSTDRRSQFCTLALLSETTTVSFTLHADYMPNARGVAEAYTLNRRSMGSVETLTDVPDLGSGAFWFADGDRSYLQLHDGNLSVNIRCGPVSSRHKLPADMGQRLVRVATGTLAALRR